MLFPRLLLLSEREALSFFPAFRAFLSVVSAFTVSHNSQHSAAYIKPQTSKILWWPSPDCSAIATERANGGREFSEFEV
jgi:hypothetical protein